MVENPKKSIRGKIRDNYGTNPYHGCPLFFSSFFLGFPTIWKGSKSADLLHFEIPRKCGKK
jgi:hypothetical protein